MLADFAGALDNVGGEIDPVDDAGIGFGIELLPQVGGGRLNHVGRPVALRVSVTSRLQTRREPIEIS